MYNWDHRYIRSTTNSHTCSNPGKVQVTHTALELNVDFSKKVLTGNAILTLKRIQEDPPINEITLDILGLKISSVTNLSDRIPLRYEIGSKNFGNSLCIVLQSSQAIDRIRIEYETLSPEYFPEHNSPALLWLTPPQTADQTHPFLLSDNKLIYARSWFPCQDTPSVKFAYSAKISVPKNYTVLMSAIRQNINRNSPDLNVYEFNQRNPVPSYAVVIAVGSLPLERSQGRVFIYAEKYTPNFGRLLLATIEEMLRTAARLCGPYLWEKYVICVLPPSIAHLEIECPCLTFIPRTILGADRSHISKYLARNIAQSWAGHLVTCLSWEHLWLNKSFSIFISRKIICQIAEVGSMSVFLQQKGLRNLNKMIQNPRNFGLIRRLVPDMATWPPHTVTEYVPYEWGCKLLDYLQNKLGGPRVFEQFLRAYFEHFAQQSINTQNWIDYLSEKFPDHMEMLSRRLYLYLIEIPSISGDLPNRSPLEQHCDEIANRWIEWNCDAYPDIPVRRPPSNLTDVGRLCDVQKIIFIKSLHSSHTRMTIKKLRYLRHFIFGRKIFNAEIRYFWLLLCIKVQWDHQFALALNFAIENCSPNYACPIFQHLCEWEEKRDVAIGRFNDNKNKMLFQTWESLHEIYRILHLIPRQN